MAVVRVVSNGSALQTLFHDQHGGLARDLARRAIRVQNHAKLNATGRAVAGARNPAGRGPRVQTGRLRSSIAWGIFNGDVGISARIGTNVSYAMHLELGLRGGRTYPFLADALGAARG